MRRVLAAAVVAVLGGLVVADLGATIRGDLGGDEFGRDLAAGLAVLGGLVVTRWALAELEEGADSDG